MCTVTVVPFATCGFRLMCNRDEQWSRPVASAPAIERAGRHDAIFPRDPRGGGTWVGANSAGLAVAVLNRHDDELTGCVSPTPQSRGGIAVQLLGCGGLNELIESVRVIAADQFALFRLLAIQKQRAVIASSTGDSIDITSHPLTRPLLLTSSALGDSRVEWPRRELFARLVSGRPEQWLSGQAQFHRHHWPDHPEVSVSMARDDAGTVSRSVIDVSSNGVRFHYEPLQRAALARAA